MIVTALFRLGRVVCGGTGCCEGAAVVLSEWFSSIVAVLHSRQFLVGNHSMMQVE